MKCSLLLHFVAMLFSLSAHAQQWQVFNMDNAGFPSNTVVDVVQDGQGVIWAATDFGLCRYQGGEWTVFQQEPGGLPSNSLSCLAVDSLDRLWVGTVTGGIGIFDGLVWSYMDAGNSPIVTEGVTSIAHDYRGWVWICTELGLHCWTGSEWRLYNDTPESHNGGQLFGNNMASVAVRPDGLVSVATRNAGLVYITEEDLVYYTASSANFPDNSANDIALDSNGDRWLACPSGGLVWHAGPHDDQLWFQYSMNSVGFPNNTMRCVIIGPNNRKYVGTETWGILLFDSPGDWTSLDAQNSGLPDNDVRSLMIDDQGVLWAGTNLGGLARYDPFTSVNDITSEKTPIRIHPNPFNDGISVDLLDMTGDVQWELLDAIGRVVLVGKVQGGREVAIALGEHPSGPYLLRLASQGSVQVRRIVSQ